MLISFADVKVRIASLCTGITCIQVDVDKVYNYVKALAIHILTPIYIQSLDLMQLLSEVKEGIATLPRLSLPNDLKEDIWIYYKLLQIIPLVFDVHLAVILQSPLVDRLLQMNIYMVYSLPILHPRLQKNFQYILGDYLANSSYGDFTTLPATQDVIICGLMKGHMCHFNTALYPVACINWCIYKLFTNVTQRIEKNCQHDIEPQSHNLASSLKEVS